nr:hypothetical protein BSM_02140 [uncultured archaeon]
MKRKTIVCLIVIVAIESIVAFSGCIEEEVPESTTHEIPAETYPEVTEPSEEPRIQQPSEELKPEITLEKFDGGFFSTDKPKGWNIYTAGVCSEFAFLIRDDEEPSRQIFYFGLVGPVYMSEEQKQIDYQYMNMGGYAISWIEMPVVDPLTPQNFLSQFHFIVQTEVAQSFMPQAPKLENLQIISTTSQYSFIAGGETELIRAIFVQDGKVVEGLFLVTVAPFMPYTGGPGGGNACGLQIIGITSPEREFRELENTLVTSVQSFTITQSYVDNCMRQQAETYAGILKAGKTLSEASDIIMDGWEKRNKVDDITAKKRSDAILSKERAYDPETGNVYEFDSGFYEKYNINREKYEMNNLKPLPGDDWDIWMKAPLDGYRYVK